MKTETQAESVADLLGQSGAEPGVPGFASLRQSAALEFHASLQLLAERARFLTGAAGVAVALDQDGQFVYCAAAGNMVPEIGARAHVQSQEQIERLSIQTSTGKPHLAVPVLRDETVVGFLELVPGAEAFEVTDVEAISRLCAMVCIALEHRDAAEQTEKLVTEPKAKTPDPAPTAGPVLWHAPEATAPEPTPAESSQSPAPADVHACAACGFPVSGRRTLCLDCETHRDDPRNDPKPDANPPAEMFATEPHENWINAHGYTIASLLVSALAAAIIYWLR
jgi:hypothetical protein